MSEIALAKELKAANYCWLYGGRQNSMFADVYNLLWCIGVFLNEDNQSS